MNMNNLIFDFPDYRIEFSPGCAGFPSSLKLKQRHEKEQELLRSQGSWLTIQAADGTDIVPVLPDDYKPKTTQSDGTVLIDFWNIPLTARGKILSDWFLNLSYELNEDGVGFIHLFFSAMTLPLPDLKTFRLRIPLNFQAEKVTYGYWRRPESINSSSIQAVDSFVRNQTEKKNLRFSHEIIPLIGFDYGISPETISCHFEWMAEGQNSIGADPKNVSSTLIWEQGEPTLIFDFIETNISSNERPYQWRNQMGFVLGQTPKVRRHPPLRVYHYLDLFRRYPTDNQIQKMAAEGADVLILHEGWRADLQNGGVPYTPSEFMRVVDCCHRYGIRVAPYIRGNESSVRENQASWFNFILQKDFDGLYSDYGGPAGYYSQDETYPGGRFAYKEHYKTMKALKNQTIGKDGIFYLHTGPFFSGSTLPSLVDGYTSGEGEKGIMLSSRRAHAYFSESALGPGSLWTAAFPEYKTGKILPYMANIGQTPHVTLGVQLRSSSLAHPSEPDCVTFARPLWKLYGLMQGERDLQFSNDQCDEEIRCDSIQTGGALYRLQDGTTLLILSNFRDKSARCTVNVPWLKTATGQACYRLSTGESGTSCIREQDTDARSFSMELPPYGIGGFLICPENEKWRKRVAKYLRPYPQPDQTAQSYWNSVEQMRRLRFEPEISEKQYLRVHISTLALGWEDAVWWDLFDSVYELYITPDNGVRTFLGYIGNNGFMTEPPSAEEKLWPGKQTPWIPLHKLLPKGRTLVELRARHLGEDFYSFAEADCAPEPDRQVRQMIYMSELDSDRARMTFYVCLS